MAKVVLTASGVALALALNQPAAAQSTAAAVESAQTPAPATQMAQTEPTPEMSAGEIIVTARRREESLQKVPLSVQAFSAETLSRSAVTKVSELVAITPSLNVGVTAGPGSNAPSYELRGIAVAEVLPTQDPTVGIYVNDVYQARPIGTNATFIDLANVQVLLGPQGTLFGRNTPAGAIVITTKRPTDVFEGEVGTTVGNYGRFDAHGIVNIPVTDGFAIRLVGQRTHRDGYTRDIGSGRRLDKENNYSFRGSALFKSGDFENLLVADYYRAKEPGVAAILTDIVPFAATATGAPPGLTVTVPFLYPGFAGALAAQQARGPRRAQYGDGAGFFSNAEAYGVSNTTTIELNDAFTIKNIFGYRHTFASYVGDSDGTALPILVPLIGRDRGHQFSDELQLQYSDSNLNAIVGLFYLNEKSRQITANNIFCNTSLGSFCLINNSVNDFTAVNNAKAVFAQATYKFPFLEDLSLTLGGRYSWDDRKLTGSPSEFNPATNAQGCLLPVALQDGGQCAHYVKATFKKPTYNVSFDYQITPNKLIYIAHRRGYRSGGFDGRAATLEAFTPYRPEIVNDLEVGFKLDWRLGGDAHLRTNLAVYETWYKDIQRGIVVPPATTVVRNAARAKIKGLEFNAVLTPVRGVNLTGYLGYVDAKHTSYDTLVTAQNAGALCGDTLLTTAQIGTSVGCRNVGFGVAKYTYGFGATVTAFDRPDLGEVQIGGNFAYRGPYQGRNDLPFLTGRVGPQNLLNLTFDWNRIAGSGASAEFFVRNALDKTYANGILTTQTSLGYSVKYYAPPRMYGVSLKYDF